MLHSKRWNIHLRAGGRLRRLRCAISHTFAVRATAAGAARRRSQNIHRALRSLETPTVQVARNVNLTDAVMSDWMPFRHIIHGPRSIRPVSHGGPDLSMALTRCRHTLTRCQDVDRMCKARRPNVCSSCVDAARGVRGSRIPGKSFLPNGSSRSL